MDTKNICQRCMKDCAANPIHTCSPTKRWRELEKQRDDLLATLECLAELCDQYCRHDRRFDDALDAADAAIAAAKK